MGATISARFAHSTLGSYGLSDADMAEVIEKGSKAGSMKANPIALTNEEQREILGQAV